MGGKGLAARAAPGITGFATGRGMGAGARMAAGRRLATAG